MISLDYTSQGKPEGRKIIAHGVSRVEYVRRRQAQERGDRLLSTPEVAPIFVCQAMLS